MDEKNQEPVREGDAVRVSNPLAGRTGEGRAEERARRRAREAAALRANLLRRKAQARARAQGQPPEGKDGS